MIIEDHLPVNEEIVVRKIQKEAAVEMGMNVIVVWDSINCTHYFSKAAEVTVEHVREEMEVICMD